MTTALPPILRLVRPVVAAAVLSLIVVGTVVVRVATERELLDGSVDEEFSLDSTVLDSLDKEAALLLTSDEELADVETALLEAELELVADVRVSGLPGTANEAARERPHH